jgi:phthiocerol/phenolphthiocerol synthesis type-I polyketide synthase E
MMTADDQHAVAVIGMAGRFPGAADLAEFWDNLVAGRDTISRFSPEESRQADGQASMPGHRRYVAVRGVLEDIDYFDAAFFGMPPREAAITDPQHRIFLETAWEAVEAAGYDPRRTDELIAVYAGCGSTTYLTNNVIGLRNGDDGVTGLEAVIGNDKDYLAGRVAYKLGLRGPAIGVQTACSTSLVSVALACQALQAYDCDIALAGGVNVHVPQASGYLWREGGIMSPDGTCRPFDEAANGTVMGNGTGVVVLRRLVDAVRQRDDIAATITGWALTNDGAAKVGFTAPSVDGQRRAILTAQARAGRAGTDIGYVETHGTGTALGDAIEITALTEAFQATSAQVGNCYLGAVKSNIGHTDAAAGVAGLIKTILTVRAGVIPPQPHFAHAGPELGLAAPRFRVATTAQEWSEPRRAGVSSFGIGGTNAHVIVEQAPVPAADNGADRPAELLLLSARTPQALHDAAARLADHLSRNEVRLADVAHTLAVGRSQHDYRWSAACSTTGEALSRLTEPFSPEPAAAAEGGVAFLFPGGGAQYSGLARELYDTQEIFRAVLDECAEAGRKRLGIDLVTPALADSDAELEDGTIGLPVLFAAEYALARLLVSWGICPSAVAGHSLGEYTAATLAGVFRLADAVELVGTRGRLLDKAAKGAMLSVRLELGSLADMLGTELDIAAHNGTCASVVSGPEAAIRELEQRLDAAEAQYRRVPMAVAAHSRLIEPVIDDFRAAVARVPMSQPSLRIVSNRTGTWLSAEAAATTEYWVGQLRDSVRFADGLATMRGSGLAALLEVGPGHTLTRLARAVPGGPPALATMPAQHEPRTPLANVLEAVGRLWRQGQQVDWTAMYAGRACRRVPLPSYPWQRRRYWVDVEASGSAAVGRALIDVGQPRPDPDASLSRCPAETATDRDELGVAEEFGRILGSVVGSASNFFELGGESLAGLRLVNRLADRFAVPITLRTLFDNPTAAELSVVIIALRGTGCDEKKQPAQTEE